MSLFWTDEVTWVAASSVGNYWSSGSYMKINSLNYGSVWERGAEYKTFLYSDYRQEIPGGIPMGADITPTRFRVGLRMRRHQPQGAVGGALRVNIELVGYATNFIDLTTANENEGGLYPEYTLEGDAAYWGMDDLQFKAFLNTLFTSGTVGPTDPQIIISSDAVSEADPMQLQVQYMRTQLEYDYEVPPGPGNEVKFAPRMF